MWGVSCLRSSSVVFRVQTAQFLLPHPTSKHCSFTQVSHESLCALVSLAIKQV